jgi:hypothetical protein
VVVDELQQTVALRQPSVAWNQSPSARSSATMACANSIAPATIRPGMNQKLACSRRQNLNSRVFTSGVRQRVGRQNWRPV